MPPALRRSEELSEPQYGQIVLVGQRASKGHTRIFCERESYESCNIGSLPCNHRVLCSGACKLQL
jgi:hypothetical protein